MNVSTVQVTASCLLGLDQAGGVAEGAGLPELSGACIHLGVRRARPGAKVTSDIDIIRTRHMNII